MSPVYQFLLCLLNLYISYRLKLSDLANLVLPFSFGPEFLPSTTSSTSSTRSSSQSYLSTGFVGLPESQYPITLKEIQEEYYQVTGRTLDEEEFGAVRSWMMFRVRSYPLCFICLSTFENLIFVLICDNRMLWVFKE